jgi:pyruvate/2-oxoglutarate dehydrogenase complex dihydrolipoamide acyltransferase (E2) component
VVVVESDKADMDVETFYEGYIATILVQAGEAAPVGAAIALVAETEAEIETAQQPNSGERLHLAQKQTRPRLQGKLGMSQRRLLKQKIKQLSLQTGRTGMGGLWFHPREEVS